MLRDKNMKRKTLSKKQQKVIKTFQDLGISRVESHILMYMFTTKKVTAKDIEKNAGLNQPDVSLGTHALMDRGWMKISSVTKKRKGRPYYRYSLARHREYILNEIQTRIEKRIELEKRGIQTLHNLLDVKNQLLF